MPGNSDTLRSMNRRGARGTVRRPRSQSMVARFARNRSPGVLADVQAASPNTADASRSANDVTRTRIRRRIGIRSTRQRETGNQTGHTTSVSPRNAITDRRWTTVCEAASTVSPTRPSLACCAANRSGTPANIRYGRAAVRATDADPTPASTPDTRNSAPMKST